jgi:hypothetical protein
MNKKTALIVGLVALVGVGSYYVMNQLKNPKK